MSDMMAKVREVLVGGESEAVWARLCRLVDEASEGERVALVAYVGEHTQRWAETLRRPLYGWWKRHREGEDTGFEGMVGDWSAFVWDAGKEAGEEREVPGLPDAKMVWCPPGTFMMGSPGNDEEAEDDEKPQREVTLTRGFWMGQTPVTQDQYEAVMGENPSYFNVSEGGGPHHPVEQVSWDNALAFCNALSVKLGLPACFESEGEGNAQETRLKEQYAGEDGRGYVGIPGFRLPTEAEWEYACRAGTTAPRYDDDLDAIAWYKENSGERMHAVKELVPNKWGLHDMLGNVWEWCWDWVGDYSLDAVLDPVGPSSGSNRVDRGGCWYANARDVRAALRDGGAPGFRFSDLGFRLVRVGLSL